ncbi:hypothetical protein GCM10010285_60890 [Streptomyces pseudogriseolus]|uniref:Uncharacterized protein n=1 Tax=Streptomyces pseudogriseolus TaxID=36817 RepID=A0ABQ2TJR5_STREZ|nr:hypothetical protein GCM10010285_60890 [Streptomyces rubiginosus]
MPEGSAGTVGAGRYGTADRPPGGSGGDVRKAASDGGGAAAGHEQAPGVQLVQLIVLAAEYDGKPY